MNGVSRIDPAKNFSLGTSSPGEDSEIALLLVEKAWGIYPRALGLIESKLCHTHNSITISCGPQKIVSRCSCQK